ncbi:TVP38/TMEM64 family protein [Tropicimonas sp. IMCC34043]|uniref:TVP38/TMEM64 family protein n=1 Tax=Tropicimonas sp. IMCC34043 TaxID=2248760 RepID=UPI0035199A5C
MLPFGVLIVVAVTGAILLHDRLSFEALANHREALIQLRDAHYLAAVTLFIVAYAAMVTFSLPGATLATLTGGYLFGVFPGVLFNVSAATLGAIALFCAARHGFGDALAARMDATDGRVKRIKRGIDANQWEMLFLIRLMPLVPFFVANLIPALVGVPLGRFAITTFLGIIPAALVYTSAGSGLGHVFTAGEMPDPGLILTAPVLLPILGLCLLVALPIVLKSRFSPREP